MNSRLVGFYQANGFLFTPERNRTSLGVVWIRAVLNDGNVECWNGEDEEERSTDLVSFYLPGLKLRFLLAFLIKDKLLFQSYPWLPSSLSQLLPHWSWRVASEVARTSRVDQVKTRLWKPSRRARLPRWRSCSMRRRSAPPWPSPVRYGPF